MPHLTDEDIARIRAKYPETKKRRPEPPTIEKQGAVYRSGSGARAVKSAFGAFGRTRHIMYAEEDQVHYVYFVQSEDNKYIKIGHTLDLNKRMSQLQTGSSAKLSYLNTILFPTEARAIEVEEALHEIFHELRLHGEWFVPSTQLLEFIKAHQKDTEELTSALESALKSK